MSEKHGDFVVPDKEQDPIKLLQSLPEDQTWGKLAPRYGVTQPDPPWAIALQATFDCLTVHDVLPSLERRFTEDRLVETLYKDVPAPELQLVSLAHTMMNRGLISEDDLAKRMKAVRARLEEA